MTDHPDSGVQTADRLPHHGEGTWPENPVAEREVGAGTPAKSAPTSPSLDVLEKLPSWAPLAVLIGAVIVVLIVGLAVVGGDDGGEKSAERTKDTRAVPGVVTDDGGLIVTRKDFGDKWPLTIDKGTIRCDAGALTLETPDKTYTLNPEAQQRQLGESLATVWAPNPAIEGARMSTSGLIEAGSTLC